MASPDMAAPDLAEVEVHGVTRTSFILRGALSAGALYGVGAVAPFVSDALAEATASDIDILNFALTLEYLETDFYQHKATMVGLSGEAKALAATIAGHEQLHVQALVKAVKAGGGTPVKKPTFVFPVTDQSSFLKLAYVLENTGVGAYNGAGPKLSNSQYLMAAGSIVQVEARHAAAIGLLTGQSVTPAGGFDIALTKSQVLAKAGPLIKA